MKCQSLGSENWNSIYKGMRVTHLITTACEETWPKDTDQPVLFLGEWCKAYSKKELWQQFNSETSPYHWDDRKKLHSDYQVIQDTYEKTLVALRGQLNTMHQVNYSVRYWRILIGPWLEYFIQVLFDRWFMLRQIFADNKNYSCSIIRRDPLLLVPNDMSEFNKLLTEDDWNEAIYGQLIHLYWKDRVDITLLKNKNKKKSEKVPNKSIKSTIKRVITFLGKIFSKEDDYLFISSYLPLKQELKLQVQLGQIPYIWPNPHPPFFKPSNMQRQWKVNINPVTDFERVVRSMISLHIPTIYLEGYRALDLATNELPWPKNPKAVFTSNSYSENDLFKNWAAKKTELGVPLVIGQHGGGYGTSLFLPVEEHQVKIADKWLSWGWSDKIRKNIIPIGYWKSTTNNFKINHTGDALMVEFIIPRYSYRLYASPIAGQWLDYFNDQKLFLSKLPNTIRKKTVLKLDGNDYGWDPANRWKDAMPELLMHNDTKSIKKLIQDSRICIATYNSTTFLEAFVMNVPTIMFWNPDHWEVNSTAQPYYDKLKSVGIFHESPESAAKQMAKVWNDVGRWWLSEEVQAAKNEFCKQYARDPENSLEELYNFFQTISKK